MRKRLLQRIPSIIFKNQKSSILFFSFLTLFFIYRSTSLTIKTGIETFLPEKNKRVIKYKEILESFKTESNIIVLLEGKEEDVKSYADHIHPILSESSSVNSVLHKSPADFMYKHGLKLLPYTLVDSVLTTIESNTPVLSNFNPFSDNYKNIDQDELLERAEDFFKIQYEYIINDDFFDSQVNECDFSLEEMCNATSGKCLWLYNSCVESDIISKSADMLLFGENYFYSNNLALMIIEPSFNSLVTLKELRNHINSIDSIVNSEAKEFNVKAGITGSLVYARDEWDVIEKETYFLLTVTLIGIYILLSFAFKSYSAPLICLVVIVVGLCWTLGIYSFFGRNLTITTIMMSVVIVGLGIDYCIHILSGFVESFRKKKEIFKSLLFSLDRFGPGVVTGSLTTSFAFFAMIFSSNEGISDLGKIAGIGILVMMFVSISLLPLLLNIFFHNKRAEAILLKEDYLRKIINSMHMNKIKISFLLIPATLLLIFAALKIEYDYNFINMQPKNLKSIQLQEKLIENFNFSSDFVWLTARNSGEASRYLKEISQIDSIGRIESINNFLPDMPTWTRNIMRIRRILKSDEIDSVSRNIDYRDYMNFLYNFESKLIDRQRLENNKKLEALIGSEHNSNDGILSKFLNHFESKKHSSKLMYFSDKVRDVVLSRLNFMANYQPLEVSNIPSSISSRYISNNNFQLISVYPSSNVWEDTRYLNDFTGNLINIDSEATGMPIIFVELMDMMTYDTNLSTSIALFIIILILAFDFRSFRYCALSLAPVFFGFIYMFGFMSLFGIKLNLINMSAIPLIFGIGIDDGIHIAHRYKMEKNLAIAFSSSGRAVMLTTITTMFGFGVLSMSTHRGLASMGLSLFLGVFFCLVSTFVIFSLFTKKSK